MNLEVLITIINDWDPIDLFPMAPKDEYEDEAKAILDYIQNHRLIDVNGLAMCIHNVFTNAFG